VIHHLGGSTAGGPYDPRLDVNADGRIDADDLRSVLLRHGTRLPAGEPNSSSDGAAVIATDAVFERLGAGPAPQPAAQTAAGTPPQGSSEDFLSRGRRLSESNPLESNPLVSNIVASTDQQFTRRRAARARRAAVEAIDAALTVEPSPLRERIAIARRARRDG